MSTRRYDIDWLRVIAIGLLLLYHVAIGFQPWGIMLGFITNKQSWATLWIPMTMLNIWRIPLVFFVSGMGVYFSMQNRNWKQLLQERVRRILIPFLFGIFFIVPLSSLIWQHYYHWDLTYNYNPGHLWFLGNIFAYVLILCPVFFYLKRQENGKLATRLKKFLSSPLGLLPIIAAFMVEAILMDPTPYELYAMTWHGFFLGLLAFFFGFCFVLSGATFWRMLLRWRWLFLVAALALYSYRLFQSQMQVPGYLLAIESNVWIFAIFSFAYKYLNRPSKALSYLSKAAYPIYIIHMISLFLASILIFPMDINTHFKFILVLLLTGIGCFTIYEYVLRRIHIVSAKRTIFPRIR